MRQEKTQSTFILTFTHANSSDSIIHLLEFYLKQQTELASTSEHSEQRFGLELASLSCSCAPPCMSNNHRRINNNRRMVSCGQTGGARTRGRGLVPARVSVSSTRGGGDPSQSHLLSSRQIVIRGGKHSLKPERAHWCHSRVFVRSEQGTEWSWGFN